ncbi:hypothetical protein GCM10008966_00960 [Rhodovulum strictum]
MEISAPNRGASGENPFGKRKFCDLSTGQGGAAGGPDRRPAARLAARRGRTGGGGAGMLFSPQRPAETGTAEIRRSLDWSGNGPATIKTALGN